MFRTSRGDEPAPRMPSDGGCERVLIPSPTLGWSLECWLYMPAAASGGGEGPGGGHELPPLLCLWHGVGGRKDAGLQVMAADLSYQASVATLACDFRFFGGSDGTPRNLIDPVLAAEDMLAVLRHVRADPWFAARVDIDRIGLLGCSMGGGVACAAALQAEAEGIELMAVVSYVGAVLSNLDPTSAHAKTAEEQRYFDACVHLDVENEGSIFLPVTDRTQIGPVGRWPGFPGATPGFEGRCFLKNYCQVGCILPPYVEQARENHPPARGYARLGQGLATLRPHKAVVKIRAPVLHIAGATDHMVNPSGDCRAVRKVLEKKSAAGTVAELVVLPCEHNSVYPLMNPDYHEWIKPWMGDDPLRLYRPEVYGQAITAVAQFLVRHGMRAAAMTQPRAWSGVGYTQMGLMCDVATGLTTPTEGFEPYYWYVESEMAVLEAAAAAARAEEVARSATQPSKL